MAWHPFKTSMGCLEQNTGDIHTYVELTLVLYQVFWQFSQQSLRWRNFEGLCCKIAWVNFMSIVRFSKKNPSNTWFYGVFLESPKAFSESFRGTGETFVFKLRPDGFKRFPWTGENNYFYRLTQESLIVGSGDGNFAIWIDSDFYKGRSAPCSTFDNEQVWPIAQF